MRKNIGQKNIICIYIYRFLYIYTNNMYITDIHLWYIKNIKLYIIYIYIDRLYMREGIQMIELMGPSINKLIWSKEMRSGFWSPYPHDMPSIIIRHAVLAGKSLLFPFVSSGRYWTCRQCWSCRGTRVTGKCLMGNSHWETGVFGKYLLETILMPCPPITETQNLAWRFEKLHNKPF